MRKKKIIAFLFAAFILFPLAFSGGLQVIQLYLKHRALERLEAERLITVSFLLENVEWVEEEKEIMVDGKMFDLKRFSKKGNVLIATGAWDEDETSLVNVLRRVTEKKQAGMIIQILLLTQLLSFSITWLCFALVLPFINRHFWLFDQYRSNIFFNNIFQPPRYFSPSST